MTTTQATLTSKDGTTIAYETAGSGPAVVVISTVAEDRTGVAGIASLLAEHFTVVNFDRRGRGGSGDPQPYDPAREVEDIEALIDAVGGTAALVSGSAGCVLALDATSALGPKVTALHLYEPPFIVSDARPPVPADYVAHQEALVAAGKRSEAVEYFMTQALLVPAEWVEGMKQDPSWDQMAALAHTYAYDGRIVRGTQDGTPLPRDRWSVDAPVLVLVGENSEPFFLEGAHALAEILPHVTVQTLPGQDHGAFWMAPDAVVESIRAFLGR
jgi:pimeloyl-ACP methyl ester carboxylesterase